MQLFKITLLQNFNFLSWLVDRINKIPFSDFHLNISTLFPDTLELYIRHTILVTWYVHVSIFCHVIGCSCFLLLPFIKWYVSGMLYENFTVFICYGWLCFLHVFFGTYPTEISSRVIGVCLITISGLCYFVWIMISFDQLKSVA